jgi:hypothetical protein
MDAYRAKRQKRISLQQENRVAQELEGRTQAASGATRLGGGADVRADGVRVECKYTEGTSYSLKRSDWKKLCKQALRSLEEPVMQLWFKNGRLTSKFAIVKVRKIVDEKSVIMTTDKKSISLNLNTIAFWLLNEKTPLYVNFLGYSHGGDPGDLVQILSWDTYLESRNHDASS